jgi:hypothetical protein
LANAYLKLQNVGEFTPPLAIPLNLGQDFAG